MEPPTRSFAPMVFDVRKQTTELKGAVKGWRVFAVVFAVLGIGMAVLAGYLELSHGSGAGGGYAAAVAVFAVVGLIVAAACWGLAVRGGALPNTIVVTSIGLELRADTSRGSVTLRWSDPDLNLRLIDRRGLPGTRLDGKSRNKFAFAVESGPRIPIPQQAFEAILGQAESRNLKITRRTLRGQGIPGTYEVISVRSSKT